MNKEFSPNMLKTYKTCPYKFYLKYERNISVPQNSTEFEKGTKIHALANYYLKGENISKFEKILTEDEKLTWKSLKNNEYFQKKCVKSEYILSCKVDDFWVGGRLDALMKDDNKYFILDYKTGAIPQNPEYDFQTMVYLLSVYKYLKTDELAFIYIDLKNNKNYRIDLTSEKIKEYEHRLTEICLKIVNDKSYVKTSFCNYCEYKAIC